MTFEGLKQNVIDKEIQLMGGEGVKKTQMPLGKQTYLPRARPSGGKNQDSTSLFFT